MPPLRPRLAAECDWAVRTWRGERGGGSGDGGFCAHSMPTRWLRRVLRAVGEVMGEGETARGKGDLGAAAAACAGLAAVGTDRVSLGLAARRAVAIVV